MHSHALKVMGLQPFWTDKNSAEMQERGALIRSEIPLWLRTHRAELVQALGRPDSDFVVEGRDGTGRKTEIPWVRFCSKSHSPSATEGWYCVYLFEAKGNALYLCLIHAATRFRDGEFKPRSSEELAGLVSWARGLLRKAALDNPRIISSIALNGRTKLGPSYERSTALAIRYSIDALPLADQLLEDAKLFSQLLATVYDAQDTGNAPEAPAPDIAAAIQSIDKIANPLQTKKRTGQGFGLTAPERRAVEQRAMSQATFYLEQLGYTTKDVSASESYDILATDTAGQEYTVEVKGTTSGPAEVFLTTNEVQLSQARYPYTFLIVVHGVCLNRCHHQPTATGGELLAVHPWKVESERLTALSFRYQVPVE